MVYKFIDTDTHKNIGELHLSVELKTGHKFTGFGKNYIVVDVDNKEYKYAVVYIKEQNN